MTMEIRAARDAEIEEVIDLAAAVFVERCRPRYASQHLEDSTYVLHQSRVCVVDGRVVSQVRVSEREMRIGSAVVKLGGIGLVGTLEKYRRNGYSSAVLRDAVGYMADEGYDLGLLFTSIQPFYARLGWAPFPQTNFEIEVGRRREFESSHWTVREFELKDLPRVIEIYGEHNRARTGTIVRKPRQWSDGYGRQTGMPPTLVAERNGVIGAYANVGLGEGDANNVGDAFLSTYYPNIRELGCAAGSEDALVALCRGVLERAHDAGLEAITGRLPRHDTMTLLLSRESGMSLSFSIHERSMYRVISLSSLLTKIAPELQRRLESAGDHVRLRLLSVRCRRPVLRAHRGPRQRPRRGRRPRKDPAGARLIPLLQAALRRLDLQRARRLQSRPGSKPQPKRRRPPRRPIPKGRAYPLDMRLLLAGLPSHIPLQARTLIP